ncbi:hypothetical protein BO78DRAFT_411983 [Aspergillus sclerotiicarbonarius CBS 121057]|uniref:Uncharacterized protein n=1 Tax=Aspergillus sclerotiicarbonarius (strain CBS 121057 / IBT 28362) TaxID=1448318 RepID=A0A319EIZ1_ASPSB|nr:hypothetical protein BO78DRAFT_411983 [Aspergillus sclerotiicarbonarius CBS 121057]
MRWTSLPCFVHWQSGAIHDRFENRPAQGRMDSQIMTKQLRPFHSNNRLLQEKRALPIRSWPSGRVGGLHVIPGEPLLRQPGQRRPAGQSEFSMEKLAGGSPLFDSRPRPSPPSAIEPAPSFLLLPLSLSLPLPLARAAPLSWPSPPPPAASLSRHGSCWVPAPRPLVLRHGPAGPWPTRMMLFFRASVGRKCGFRTRLRCRCPPLDWLPHLPHDLSYCFCVSAISLFGLVLLMGASANALVAQSAQICCDSSPFTGTNLLHSFLRNSINEIVSCRIVLAIHLSGSYPPSS